MGIINLVQRFAAVAAIFALSLSGLAEEKLVRGDFEFDGMSGMLGWNSLVCAGGEGTVEPLAEPGHGGKPAVRISGAADRFQFYSIKMQLVVGEPYRFSARFRTKGLRPGSTRMRILDTRGEHEIAVDIPEDTGGKWILVEKTGPAPECRNPGHYLSFDAKDFPVGASLDICDPQVVPLSEKAQKRSSSFAVTTPLIGRIVPVEPLLTEVDADTGYIRFLPNLSTNGCELIATVDGRPLGPLPEGRHEVNVKLVEKTTGKVRCENTYPFIAKRKKPVRQVGRRLNNFVVEVLNTELKDGTYAFENPRFGQVFIGFDRPYEKAKAYLSGIRGPVVTYRRDEPSETIRTLEPGKYTLSVEGASGGRLRVHLIKPLSIYFSGNDKKNFVTDIHRTNPIYGWDFFRKCALPSCGRVELSYLSLPQANKERLFPELLARGKVLVARTGVGPTRLDKLADRKFIYSRLRGHCPYQEGLPLIWDEFGLHASSRDLNLAGEEMWALANEMRPNGVYADFFGICGRELKDYSPVVALISAVINSGRGTGYLMSESYIRAYSDIKDIDAQIDSIAVNMKSLSRMMPEAGKRIIHLLNGFMAIGSWTSRILPEVDEKVLLDHWLHRMATEPQFADVGGLSNTIEFGGEELFRWHVALMHHYAVLGRTDSMVEVRGWKYKPETVRDGDFNEGFKHWNISAAEPGSVTHVERKGFAKELQKRNGSKMMSGTRFALLKRSEKGPNMLSQKIGNLKPGELYLLEFATADYANVLAPRSAKDTEPQLWAEVKGCSFEENMGCGGLYPRGANNWTLPKKSCPFRTQRFVFRANSPEAEIVISDWKSPAEPGGPIGRRATLNYISVNPYFPPSGTEAEVTGDFNVADFGAKGDGKTLDTAALQAALDACAKMGGTVYVPKGVYLTGTLVMGSDTELHLEKGAVLLGSPNLGDYARDDIYPGSHGSVKEGWSAKHLVVAFNARNVSITGHGAIDGNAEAFMGELMSPGRFGWRKGHRYGKGRRQDCNRPGQQIVFVGCENVRVEGVTLQNMNCWTCFIHGCVDVVGRNVKVRNNQTYANTDGFDIDSSRNVTVTGCDVVTGDDAFAIRGSNGKDLFDGAPSRVCENVLISNCTCSVEACGVRVGVGQGEIKNIAVRDVAIRSAGTGIKVHSCYSSRPQRGADIQGLVFSDIKMRNVSAPITVAANNAHSRAKLADILFERIDAESFTQIEVSGGGETKPDNIVFRNVKFHLLPLPADSLYPRQGATFVENAGRVEFIDCDFKVEKDEDPAVAGKRELARRAAEKPVSLVPDFKPLTIEVTEAEAGQVPFRAKNYPVDFKPGRRYRVSYFVSGRNIKSQLRGCGASSVAWLDEESGKFAGTTGYRIVGSFDRFLQSYEFDIPKTLPENFRPEVALRLYRSSGKAVFEDLLVEEVAPDGSAKAITPVTAAPAKKRDVVYVAHAGEEFYAPGHSTAAYRCAVEHGLDYIKMDLRETKDGEIVLHHDADLKKFFGRDWKIKRHTLAEIQANCRYRFRPGRVEGYNDWTNDTIQTFREGLKWGARTKRGIWLDFKDFNPKLVEKALAMAGAAGLPHSRIIVGTWSQPALAYLNRHHPDIRRVAHTYVRPKEQGYATNLAKGRTFANEDELLAALLEAKERLGLYGLNMPSGSVWRKGRGVIYDTPPGFVKRLQDNGLWVSMWFVHTPEYGKRWRTEGADAFVTNCKANTGVPE